MSLPKVYREGRCALCRKLAGHPIHQVPPSPGLLQRLARLAWPRWVWGHAEGRHVLVDRDVRVRAAEGMTKLRLRMARRAGQGRATR